MAVQKAKKAQKRAKNKKQKDSIKHIVYRMPIDKTRARLAAKGKGMNIYIEGVDPRKDGVMAAANAMLRGAMDAKQRRAHKELESLESTFFWEDGIDAGGRISLDETGASKIEQVRLIEGLVILDSLLKNEQWLNEAVKQIYKQIVLNDEKDGLKRTVLKRYSRFKGPQRADKTGGRGREQAVGSAEDVEARQRTRRRGGRTPKGKAGSSKIEFHNETGKMSAAQVYLVDKVLGKVKKQGKGLYGSPPYRDFVRVVFERASPYRSVFLLLEHGSGQFASPSKFKRKFENFNKTKQKVYTKKLSVLLLNNPYWWYPRTRHGTRQQAFIQSSKNKTIAQMGKEIEKYGVAYQGKPGKSPQVAHWRTFLGPTANPARLVSIGSDPKRSRALISASGVIGDTILVRRAIDAGHRAFIRLLNDTVRAKLKDQSFPDIFLVSNAKKLRTKFKEPSGIYLGLFSPKGARLRDNDTDEND